jgi:hypothetical protein
MAFGPGTTEALITFVLGGGAIAMVTQIIRASRLWKTGRLATTREIIRDMAAARDEAEDREAVVRQDKDYWRNVAGAYGYQLRSQGIEPDPARPMSPSERRRDGQGKSTRQRRAELAPTTEQIEAALDETDPGMKGL